MHLILVDASILANTNALDIHGQMLGHLWANIWAILWAAGAGERVEKVDAAHLG